MPPNEAEGVEPFDFDALVSRGEAFDSTETGTTFLSSAAFTSEEEIERGDAVPSPTNLYSGTPTTALGAMSPETAFTADVAPPSTSVTTPASIGDGQLKTGQINFTGPLNSAGASAAGGVLELLPQEVVVQQIGSLYLTNKRVILLSSTVIRSAFVRDIDAVGTMTERAPALHAIFGGILLALAGGAAYAATVRDTLQPSVGWAYIVNPLFTAILVATCGLFLLARYFLWIRRSLFVSVKGRPLITVSLTGWNTHGLPEMDTFVNSFFQIKDLLTGDLAERPSE